MPKRAVSKSKGKGRRPLQDSQADNLSQGSPPRLSKAPRLTRNSMASAAPFSPLASLLNRDSLVVPMSSPIASRSVEGVASAPVESVPGPPVGSISAEDVAPASVETVPRPPEDVSIIPAIGTEAPASSMGLLASPVEIEPSYVVNSNHQQAEPGPVIRDPPSIATHSSPSGLDAERPSPHPLLATSYDELAQNLREPLLRVFGSAEPLLRAIGNAMPPTSPARRQPIPSSPHDAAIKWAVRRILREQMHVPGQDPLPAYPIPSGRLPGRGDPWVDVHSSVQASEAGEPPAKPLRIDWLALSRESQATSLLLDAIVSRIATVGDRYGVPAAAAAETIRTQAWIVLRDQAAAVRREERHPEAARSRRDAERQRSRRAERRKDKYKKRSEALTGMPDYAGESDDRNFAVFEGAMSDVETDEEESSRMSASGMVGKAGRKFIPAWRSEEAQDLLDRLDASRNLARSSIHALPEPSLRYVPLLATTTTWPIQRWMVSKTYREVYPDQVVRVQPNSGTHHGLSPSEWGSDLDQDMPRPTATSRRLA